MRLAEGQVRAVVADRPEGTGPDAERQGRREIDARHEPHAPDGQARSEALAAGVQRGVTTIADFSVRDLLAADNRRGPSDKRLDELSSRAFRTRFDDAW